MLNFSVTGLGLKIDNRMIMPGSELKLKSKPPSHWNRFGELATAQPESSSKTKKNEPKDGKPDVATPSPEVTDELKARYEEVVGKKPRKNMRAGTMIQEIEAFEAEAAKGDEDSDENEGE